MGIPSTSQGLELSEDLNKSIVHPFFPSRHWVRNRPVTCRCLPSSCVHSLTYVCVGCSFPHGKLKALQVPQLELGENYCLGFFPTWWPYILTVNIFNTRNKYCNTSLNFLFLLQPYARIVSVVTLIWALLSTLLIVLTCIFYSAGSKMDKYWLLGTKTLPVGCGT